MEGSRRFGKPRWQQRGIEFSFAEDQVVRNSQRNKTRGAFYRFSFALAEGLCFGGVEPTRVRPVGDISINGAVT
jgi:hypothetical protein